MQKTFALIQPNIHLLIRFTAHSYTSAEKPNCRPTTLFPLFTIASPLCLLPGKGGLPKINRMYNLYKLHNIHISHPNHHCIHHDEYLSSPTHQYQHPNQALLPTPHPPLPISLSNYLIPPTTHFIPNVKRSTIASLFSLRDRILLWTHRCQTFIQHTSFDLIRYVDPTTLHLPLRSLR